VCAFCEVLESARPFNIIREILLSCRATLVRAYVVVFLLLFFCTLVN